MKVILTEKVASLGNIGEIVKVSEGFARNYLIPNHKAVIADTSSMKELDNHKKRIAKKVEAARNDAKAIATKLNGLVIELVKKVGADGKLFGSVTSSEVSKELEKLGHVIERRMITIDIPIKTVGEFEIKAKLFNDVNAKFKIKVTQDQKQAEEMKAAAAAAKKAKAEAAAAAAAQAEADAQNAEQTAEA